MIRTTRDGKPSAMLLRAGLFRMMISIPLPWHSFLRNALNMSAATLRCFLWRMLTTSLRHTPVIMPAKTSIPDNGAECKSANRGRHPTDTCTNSIFSVACSTAADLLGNKAAKSIETACDFIRRRQQKIYTYLPTMRG